MNPHQEEESHLVQPEELPPGIDLRPHVYDGIQEYDQRLPNWWLWTLYIFIILYGIYWLLYYQFGLFASDEERLGARLQVIAGKQAAELETMLADLSPDVLWEMSRNSALVAQGRVTYSSQCASCHAADLSSIANGTQLPGVPLNDKTWVHAMLPGTTADDDVTTDPMMVFNIIHDGAPDPTKGMVAWGPILGPARVAEVTAYVLSYHQAPPEPES